MNDNNSKHFIEQIIENDINQGLNPSRIHTRFPPEPNGCLHIGHAKAICLDFGMAEKFGGKCNLRFDDTNPDKEEVRFVESIREDVKWLGFDWEGREFYASDYFEELYNLAIELIENEKAYVCELTPDQFKEYRGVPGSSGKNSPFRNRPIHENLNLFRRMRNGEFEDGKYVLRAKIDMSSPNLHFRDPAIYRIKKTLHHRTAQSWCIFPMYDFAHCLSDAIERITHSICTLEFEVHRPLYDWFIENTSMKGILDVQPRQYEFARLNLSYTMMSKRKLQELVSEKIVDDWDDPRMPTISGMRRRGYTATAIRNFCSSIGVTKFNSLTDFALLEHHLRQDLNKTAQRRMAVLNPLEVEIVNWDNGAVDWLDAQNSPEDDSLGSRKIAFTKNILIEEDDFMENPPKKFYRLTKGSEVRLRYGYLMTCIDVIRDENGDVIKLLCEVDKNSRGGNSPDGRKVKGTIHWVSKDFALQSKARLYDKLFLKEDLNDLNENEDFKDYLNPNSLKEVNIFCEKSLETSKPFDLFQFERLAYFTVDSKEFAKGNLVFNRTVTLKDSFKPNSSNIVSPV